MSEIANSRAPGAWWWVSEWAGALFHAVGSAGQLIERVRLLR